MKRSKDGGREESEHMRHSWLGMERYSGPQISGKHEPSEAFEAGNERGIAQ